MDLQDSHGAPGEPKALIVSAPALPDGTYMVTWRALSAVDGHVTRGVFPLVVGAGGLQISLEEEPVYLPNPLDVLARWIMYFGALALVGGFLFRQTIALPVLSQLAAPDLASAFVARQRRYGLIMCGFVALAMVLGMLVQAANAANVPIWEAVGSPVARLVGTQIGAIWLTRLGWLALLALILWWLPGRIGDWAGVAVGACLLLSISLISHAAAVPTGAWLAIGLDWVHQLGAAAWVGGLFSFVVLLQAARSGPDRERLPTVLAALVPRFTVLAIVAVVSPDPHRPVPLLAPGQDPERAGHGSRPVARRQGPADRADAGARRDQHADPASAVGTFAWRARPRLEGANRGNDSPAVSRRHDRGRARHLRVGRHGHVDGRAARSRGVRSQSPAHRADGPGQRHQCQTRNHAGRPGPNEFVAEVTGAVAPPNDVQRVQLRFTNLDDELGSSLLTLTPRDDGRFSAVSTNLTVDGTWQIEMIVRRRGLDDVRTAFRAPIVTPDAAGQPPSLDAIPNPTTIPPRQLISMMLMATGLALTFWISRTRDVRRRERTTLYAASFAVAMIGGVLYARAAITPPLPQDARTLKNPFAPDTASIARGQDIYQQQCASCHGLAGRGDGPLAATLRPRPADFRVHMAAGHTDGELFTWLSKGVPGTAMPPFESQLSETDRWHLVNYIRGFAPSTE